MIFAEKHFIVKFAACAFNLQILSKSRLQSSPHVQLSFRDSSTELLPVFLVNTAKWSKFESYTSSRYFIRKKKKLRMKSIRALDNFGPGIGPFNRKFVWLGFVARMRHETDGSATFRRRKQPENVKICKYLLRRRIH